VSCAQLAGQATMLDCAHTSNLPPELGDLRDFFIFVSNKELIVSPYKIHGQNLKILKYENR
jgi:hypothetical protein